MSWNQEGTKGEKGDPGEPGPEASTVRLFDGEGNVLGIPWPGRIGPPRAFNEALQLSIAVDTLRGVLPPTEALLFEAPNCPLPRRTWSFLPAPGAPRMQAFPWR